MNGALIGGFVSGLVVGAIATGFFLSKWMKLVVQKRWVRHLDESPEYHEGQHNAFEYCLDLVSQSEDSDQLQDWLLDAMAERIIKVENILEYKDERASSLGMEDAIAEATNKEGK